VAGITSILARKKKGKMKTACSLSNILSKVIKGRENKFFSEQFRRAMHA